MRKFNNKWENKIHAFYHKYLEKHLFFYYQNEEYLIVAQHTSHKIFLNVNLLGHAIIWWLLVASLPRSLAVQTPLWPLIVSFRNPHFQNTGRPNPPTLETSNEVTAIFSLHSNSRFRIVRNKVSFDYNRTFVIPDFFV